MASPVARLAGLCVASLALPSVGGAQSAADVILGTWQGVVRSIGFELRLALHVDRVDPSLNLPAARAALTAGGNTDFTVRELPGLNHLFQRCRRDESFLHEETLSPVVLEAIIEWLRERVLDR